METLKQKLLRGQGDLQSYLDFMSAKPCPLSFYEVKT